MPYALEEFLRKKYRKQNLHVERRIRVDNRNDRDVDQVFCHMFITVTSDNGFELQIESMPLSAAVKELITAHGGTVTERGGTMATIQLSVTDDAFLESLAKAIKAILRDEAGYYDPNWKWICRRTSGSLMRLSGKLPAYNKYVRSKAFAKKYAKFAP